MKRYRVTGVHFDSRPSSLTLEIQDSWEPQVQEMHRQNQQRIIEDFLHDYGGNNSENKLKNFTDLGNLPFSVLAFHNKFLEQVRHSFVIGAYYPALTGACALGERILNHLILALRDFYKNTPEYKKVYSKNSFDDWGTAITTLESWKILLPDVVKHFKKLAELRNKKAIHFNPETDVNDRELALEAIKLLFEIIGEQFSGFGTQPWFIKDIPGEIYIKKEWEINPFVKIIYLPNCLLVGPYYVISDFDYNLSAFVVKDEVNYEPIEISDEEFSKLRKQGRT